MIREILLALSLLIAVGLVVTGVAMINPPVAFITAGILTAGLAVLFLTEVG